MLAGTQRKGGVCAEEVGGGGWLRMVLFVFFSERESCRSEGELSWGQRRAGARASRSSPENAGSVGGTPPLLRKGPRRGPPSLHAARRPLRGPSGPRQPRRDNQADRKSEGPRSVLCLRLWAFTC